MAIETRTIQGVNDPQEVTRLLAKPMDGFRCSGCRRYHAGQPYGVIDNTEYVCETVAARLQSIGRILPAPGDHSFDVGCPDSRYFVGTTFVIDREAAEQIARWLMMIDDAAHTVKEMLP